MQKSKQKILIIGTTDCRGGAATVGWNIGQSLKSQGYDVKFIVGYKFSDSPSVYELKKPLVLDWLDQYLPVKLTPVLRYFRSFLLANDIDFGANREVLDHSWYKEADIVHCHNLHGSYFKLSTLATMASKKKVIWTLHDMWALTGNCVYANDARVWQEGESTKTRIMEYPPMLWNNSKYLWNKKKSIYKSSKNLQIVVPSGWLEGRVKTSILKDKQVTVVHNGIDTSVFKPGNKKELRTKLNLPKNKKIVAFVAQGGSHDPRKGWDYIASLASSRLSDRNLLFLCIGGSSNRVEGNIRYVENIADPRTLSDYYGASDVFLFTSLAENGPLVVLEAMGCGLPVVSFDVGGVSEIVLHKQNGYIAKYMNSIDLNHGLSWVTNLSDDEISTMSKTNRARILEHFTITRMVNSYEKLLSL